MKNTDETPVSKELYRRLKMREKGIQLELTSIRKLIAIYEGKVSDDETDASIRSEIISVLKHAETKSNFREDIYKALNNLRPGKYSATQVKDALYVLKKDGKIKGVQSG